MEMWTIGMGVLKKVEKYIADIVTMSVVILPWRSSSDKNPQYMRDNCEQKN